MENGRPPFNYAALASALVYHDKKITQYSYDALEQSFATFAAKNWVGPELAGLFARAHRICQDRRGVDEGPSHIRSE